MIFEEDFKDLRDHVQRVNKKHEELDWLKKEMPHLTHCTVQMEYSENYSWSYQDEPQQAFYDRCQVTIHPMEVHYRDTEGDLKYQSFVGIRSHSAPTTLAYIRKLVPLVKEILPELSTIPYISDSTVAQYRNKSIAKVVALHYEYFPGVQCSWDYLETGHPNRGIFFYRLHQPVINSCYNTGIFTLLNFPDL